MKLNFTKMHGTGNDMILINNLDGSVQLNSEQIKQLCDRHFGIGADGLILIESHEGADFFMNYFNSDGSTVEMCGNGIRCAALYFNSLQDTPLPALKVHTRAGLKHIQATAESAQVNMGMPQLQSEDFPTESQTIEEFELNFVSMGNPHAVSFIANVNAIELEAIGPKIETHPFFPNKINFEIVEQVAPNHLKMRVWERGCGITLACGTGACAVYVAAKQKEIVDGRTQIDLPGGTLFIDENEKGEILMTGPAVTSFTGTITL